MFVRFRPCSPLNLIDRNVQHFTSSSGRLYLQLSIQNNQNSLREKRTQCVRSCQKRTLLCIADVSWFMGIPWVPLVRSVSPLHRKDQANTSYPDGLHRTCITLAQAIAVPLHHHRTLLKSQNARSSTRAVMFNRNPHRTLQIGLCLYTTYISA